MYLTLSEAAALLERTPRTLRYLIKVGKIVGIQKGKVWLVDSAVLPLTDAQRAKLEGQRALLRETVDRVLLPPIASPVAGPIAPLPTTPAPRSGHHSALSLEVLRTTLQLHQMLCAVQTLPQSELSLASALHSSEDAVRSLCQFTHTFDPRIKQDSLAQARAQVCAALASLMLVLNRAGVLISVADVARGTPVSAPADPTLARLAEWRVKLEAELLPSLGALMRKVEKRR